MEIDLNVTGITTSGIRANPQTRRHKCLLKRLGPDRGGDWKVLGKDSHVGNLAKGAGLIEMTIPDKPRSSKQKYRLTPKGKAVLASLAKKKGKG